MKFETWLQIGNWLIDSWIVVFVLFWLLFCFGDLHNFDLWMTCELIFICRRPTGPPLDSGHGSWLQSERSRHEAAGLRGASV